MEPQMADYLLKTEPSEYSFTDLQKDGATIWDGVSNPVALRNLGKMQSGDRLIIYQTGDDKSAIGTATVVSVDASNPKNPQVEIKAGKPLGTPVSLADFWEDRKSTRLNSSHTVISYAVFCLKKKKTFTSM